MARHFFERDDMKTVVINIGNSDNKLTQSEWSSYIDHMNQVTNEFTDRTHFCGGSSFDVPWQNACWVCEIRQDQTQSLMEAIRCCRQKWKQDSAAVTIGTTELI